jgi:hypothetical protein
MEVNGQLHAPAALPPRKSPLLDPSAGLDDMEKWKYFTLPGLEIPPLW